MKAKLAFVETENEALQAQLKQLEATLAGKRDELASLKVRQGEVLQHCRQPQTCILLLTTRHGFTPAG